EQRPFPAVEIGAEPPAQVAGAGEPWPAPRRAGPYVADLLGRQRIAPARRHVPFLDGPACQKGISLDVGPAPQAGHQVGDGREPAPAGIEVAVANALDPRGRT